MPVQSAQLSRSTSLVDFQAAGVAIPGLCPANPILQTELLNDPQPWNHNLVSLLTTDSRSLDGIPGKIEGVYSLKRLRNYFDQVSSDWRQGRFIHPLQGPLTNSQICAVRTSDLRHLSIQQLMSCELFAPSTQANHIDMMELSEQQVLLRNMERNFVQLLDENVIEDETDVANIEIFLTGVRFAFDLIKKCEHQHSQGTLDPQYFRKVLDDIENMLFVGGGFLDQQEMNRKSLTP
jgi:hypothetical protein